MIELRNKKEILISTNNPETILKYLSERLGERLEKFPYLPKLPTLEAVDVLLDTQEDLSVPFLSFFSFLDHYKVLGAYLKNYAKEQQNIPLILWLNTLLEKGYPEEFFHVFSWDRTEEGVALWAHLSELWEEELCSEAS